MRQGNIFVRDEGGFTTPAVAIAILLVCALLFMSVDGFRVGTRSGQVQYVADAGALAADKAVAEFVTAGQVVDAVLLSLSLLGLTAYTVSAVAAFVPGGQGVAGRCVAAAEKIMKARDRFGKSAVRGLNAAQKALPALCAVRAAQVVEANARASGQDYVGFALVNPVDGVEVELPDTSASDEAIQKVQAEEAEVAEKSARQQRAQEKLDAAKERAWRADCGSTGMSMRERAGHLAGLSGSSNPRYSSVDTWGFSVPLARAKAYYRARYAQEPGSGASGSPELVGESVARKHFYRYALETVSRGSVPRSSSGAELPDLKELARSTEQIRATSLYTEGGYPVSRNGGKLVLHAYVGCPVYKKGSPAGTASVADVDSGRCERCDECKYGPSTLGRVPAASTSIDNGFEYYYRIVVEASKDYRDAAREAERLRSELDDARKKMAKSIRKAFKSLSALRYDPQPPGRYGCICVVVARGGEQGRFPFLRRNARMPARVAISGATLAPDEDCDQGTVVSDIAQGLVPGSGAGSGMVRMFFGAWGTMLKAHGDGNKAVIEGFRSTLGRLPLVGNDLSEWAASSFESAIRDAGLQPADLKSYKPVLVNTSQVTGRGDGPVVSAVGRLKRAGEGVAALELGDVQALLELVGDCPELGSSLDADGLVVASLPLEVLGMGTSEGKVAIPAPADLKERFAAIASALSAWEAG